MRTERSESDTELAFHRAMKRLHKKWRIGYRSMDAALSEAKFFDQEFDSIQEADSFIAQLKRNTGLNWHYFVTAVEDANNARG